jgi:hypothetical protein
MEPCGTGMSIRHRRAAAACLDALWVWLPAPPDLDYSFGDVDVVGHPEHSLSGYRRAAGF